DLFSFGAAAHSSKFRSCAAAGILEVGFGPILREAGLVVQQGMVSIVEALTPQDFYKSMTTYSDHRIWQDVYRPTTGVGEIYLKPTVIDDVLIVSFKEL